LFYNTGIATYIWVLSKNKRVERKGKIQLIDGSSFYHKLHKVLGNKRNEISKEDRQKITELYSGFANNEFSKIYDNEDFIYKEYTVMQPMQRSYSITTDSIDMLIGKGTLSMIFDPVKVEELENAGELTGKEVKKLEALKENEPLYNAIIEKLKDNKDATEYFSVDEFIPVLKKTLAGVVTEKKIIDKIADGLSIMNKKAEIQFDRKGKTVFDKDTKDTELVNINENIDDYMAREVLPHVPDAVAFFDEKLEVKKPVIKTGAEIPFTRCFYKHQVRKSSEQLEKRFIELEKSISAQMESIFR
jgi:type I restriction enzyme M protein